MLKKWKFQTTESQNLFFVSDTHFGHNKNFVFENRGYKSIIEHDESLIKIWNERVRSTDVVIHCGDFCLNSTENYCWDLIHKLNGHIYYIWGNHNSRVKDVYKKLVYERYNLTNEEIYPISYHHSLLGEKFTFVGDYMSGFINKTPFVASHFAFRNWDYMKSGSACISAHSHGNDKESNPDFLDCKRLDVGIENFGGPISFLDVMKIMDKKKISSIDHH